MNKLNGWMDGRQEVTEIGIDVVHFCVYSMSNLVTRMDSTTLTLLQH